VSQRLLLDIKDLGLCLLHGLGQVCVGQQCLKQSMQ
jgi:hypothetical protein